MTKKRNRLIAVGIALLLIIAAAVFIFPAISANADEAWDGDIATSFAGGQGTADAPYLISNGAQLARLAQEVNGGTDYTGIYFKLTADIDLGGNDWTSIGSEGSPFTGKFSGDGKTISNLKLEVGGRTPNVGLFGYNSGTIKDVYLADIDISTRGTNAAGLCAVNNSGATIDGCAVLSGNIVANNTSLAATGVAGICSNNSGTINRCYNMASVKTNVSGAGVVNANQEGGTVSNCYNAGEVSSIGIISGTNLGGICSKNIGTIKYCMNYGNVNNGDIVGGICSENDDNKGTISSCYSDSSVCKAGAVGTDSKKLTDVEVMTTEQLCGDEFWSKSDFGDEWEAGDYVGRNETSSPSRFGEISIKYPTLKDVSKDDKPKEYEAYNFKTDGADDWQPVTVIYDADGLKAISENLDGNYVLGDDIDLGGNDWTSIGSASGAFSGKFSGDGHTISGVKVNVADENEYAGLFGCSTGVIMNLAVEGDISGTNTVGGICGGNSAAEDKGIIFACSFKGTVTGTGKNIGGIVGYNFTNSKISNCFSAADVNGYDEVGGICGYNEDGATVSNTISVGTVSGSGNLVAAVCGKNEGTLTNNYFDTDVCSLVGAKDNTGAEYTDGTTGKTTAKLCDETIMQDALDTTNMWNLGIISFTYDRSNARKRVTTYTYPSLKGIAGSVYSTEVKEYNFSTDDKYSKWQPYTEISTVEEFIALGNDDSKWSGNYVLTKDIDLDGETVTPIGDGVTGTFRGNFSGDGHTISGVKISSNGDNVGLFGFAGYSSSNLTTIMNLAVEGDIEGKSFVGGICGYGNEKVEIFACSFKGSVSGGSCVGGICGGINKSCYIENCFNSGTVSGESNVGGLLGYSSYIGNVNYSINVGVVTGKNFGPICGVVSNTLNAVNNYYNSNVFSGNDTYGTAKTTDELCDKNSFSSLNLDTKIWQAGGITRTTDAKNPRMSVANTNYPSLKGVGEPLSLGNVKQYNFKTTGDDDDWQTYTEINSAADLDIIRNKPDCNYVLMKDIKLTGNFTPIGNKGSFSGKFSGNGYTISGVKINGGTRGGLFDWNKGLIMNLAVEGDVTGDSAGGICEYNYGTIYACSFKGSVKGSKWVGGISGYNTSTISNCYVIGAVEATDNNAGYAGGICGKNENGNKIEYCYFAGTSASPFTYNAICNGASPNCYYDRELYNINSNGGDALTTAALCSSNSLPDKFSDEIWETGSFIVKSTDEKFRTVSFTYPRLKEGCAAYAVNDVKQYNFGIGVDDDWAQFNEINSLGDLNNINKNHHTNYVLMKDIDLNEGTFSPILPNTSFWGYFSGNGNTIKGDIDGNEPRRNDFTALFSTNNGLIMNLAVKGNVSGADLVGGICGRNYGTIYGCSFEGSVKGKKSVGGICGEMRGSYSHIINCYVIGTIEATGTLAGGISGESEGGSSGYVDFVPPSIKNCYFVGTVTVPENAQKDAITVKTTADTYVLTVENCYYNKDIYTGSTTYGEGKTTKELCTLQTLGSAFESGEYSDAKDATNERKRTVSGKYPRLIEGCAAYELKTVKQYNFGIDSEDWQEYTEIKNAAEFVALGNDKSKWGGNYVLTADIDLKNQPVNPIGTDVSPAFTGKFSGDGNTISNVKISGENYVGLFGCCKDDAKIMNLAVVNGDISGTGAYVGGICGYLLSDNKVDSITNCSFEGSVKSVSLVGGICGVDFNGIISNCYAIADVEATGTDTNYENSAGGICGLYSPGTPNIGKISNCYFAGTVTGSDEVRKDAICGTNSDGTGKVISKCYYNKDLYTADSTKGKGLSTLEMISADALTTMGLDSNVWVKTANTAVNSSGKNGVAYYPSLKESKHVPSVNYTASLTFERTGTDALTFLDEFEVKYGGVIEFANDVTVPLNKDNCDLTAVDSNDKSVCDFTSLTTDTFTTTVTKAGSNTYTFKCVPKTTIGELLPSESLTKSLTINAAKYTLKAEDFNVIQPQVIDSTYDGKAKSATVKIVNTSLSNYGGCGDITLRYFDSDGKEVVPINAGDYTVKIDVTEGTNCKAATALTSDSWKKLTITAAQSPTTDYEFSVSRGTTTYTLSVVELPDDLGKINKFEMTHQYGNDGVITAAERKGKNIIFTLDGSKGAGYQETVKIYIDSQNYSPFGFNVTVNVNGKGTQNAPKCEVTLTHDGNGADTYTATITAVDGAEYSFDGKTWSDSNTLTGIKHGAKVNASIRMKETAELNASENVTKTLTAGADLKWKSDKDGHWQKCSKCDYEETSHSAHIFNGNSCAVCGYKKSGGSTGGGSSSGGGGSHSGGGSSGGGSSRPRNPAVDGKEMTWNDVTNEINKLTEGGEATIDLNGNTTVPKDVIKAIADKKALVTIKVNSTFSWTIDGSKLTESDITDMDFKVSVMTASGTETLRGTVGTGFKIENVTDKAVLNITFKAAHSGKFANLFKKVDGKLEFVDNVKIDENGNAMGLEVYEKGEYAVMLGELSDRPGDMDNDGILNAKDALAVLKDFARLITGKNPLVCDLNGDGYVNANDALIILKMAAGLIKI